MFDNPFSPLMGGKPDSFFGRQELIGRFERALDVRGSDDRALFITGTRSLGKTTLVERLSQKAAAAGWDTFDINAGNALNSLFRCLARFDTQSTTIAPQLSVSVLGSGGSIGGSGITQTSHYTVDDLDTLLLEVCAKANKGVFISIDEIQKVPLDDVSLICCAFQMASRKGFDIALAVAGLPYAYNAVIQHDGCTFMRRCVHEELRLLTRGEVQGAFESTFDSVKGLRLDSDALQRLVAMSSGHPYMMQLLGYFVVEYANQRAAERSYDVTLPDVEEVIPVALAAYERRSLQPLLNEASRSEVGYLRAMAGVMGENHIASTNDVARAMGKSLSQVAPYRQSLIDSGIIIATGHGTVRFAIPYLRGYMTKTSSDELAAQLIDEWEA